MPDRLLTFVQQPAFTRRWARLGLVDEDLRDLEGQIMRSPWAAPVVPGTGGARKLRFAPPSWHRGRRGAARVIYAVLEGRGWVLLMAIYGKNEQDDLSADQRREIRRFLDWERRHR